MDPIFCSLNGFETYFKCPDSQQDWRIFLENFAAWTYVTIRFFEDCKFFYYVKLWLEFKYLTIHE